MMTIPFRLCRHLLLMTALLSSLGLLAQEAPSKPRAKTSQSDMSRAKSLFSAGKRKEALGLFQRINLTKARTAESLAIEGMIWLEPPFGRIERAQAKFQQSVSLEPDEVYANLGLGLCRVRRGADLQAIPYFKRAVERDPTYVSARLELGKTLYRLRRFDEARGHLAPIARAKRKDGKPAFPEAIEFVAMIAHEKKDSGRAAKLMEVVLNGSEEQHPDRPRRLYQSACFLLAAQQESAAAKRLNEALAAGFPCIEAAHSLGFIQYEAGELAAAKSAYQQSLKMKLSLRGIETKFLHAISRYRLGLIAFRQRDFAEAERELRSAVDLDSSHPNAWHKLGQVLVRGGKVEEAKNALAQHRRLMPLHQRLDSLVAMLKDAPSDLRSRMAYGQILGALGRYRQGLEQLLAVYRVEPERSDLVAAIVTLAERAGRPDIVKQIKAREEQVPSDSKNENQND